MLGELTVGHMYIRTPTDRRPIRAKLGLLALNYAIENGHYRFSHIYQGETGTAAACALTQRRLECTGRRILLAVNGRELRGSDESLRY